MKQRLALLLAFLLLIASATNATAQSASYLFSVPQEFVNVYWNADGTESLDYVFNFVNQPARIQLTSLMWACPTATLI